MTKVIAAKVPKFTKSQNSLRARYPDKSIAPIAKSILKAIIPKRALGKLKISFCKVLATDEQLTKGFILQGSFIFVFFINSIVFNTKVKEAKSSTILPTIKIYGYDFWMFMIIKKLKNSFERALHRLTSRAEQIFSRKLCVLSEKEIF